MKRIFFISFIVLLLLFCFPSLFSQAISQKEFIKAVKDADVFFYYDEDYEKAADLYEKLYNIYPDNANLSAKLGICFLNLDGKIAESLRLLVKASSNVVKDDKDYIEFGEKAPLDTYLYLAIAYHYNDSLQKAVTLFYNAKKKLGKTRLFSDEYIDKQISDCRYAMEMEKKPQPVIINLFTPWLSEYPGASNPVISKNDSLFIFTYKKDAKNHIMCSYKSNGWRRPVDITRQLGGGDGLYSNSITGDGKQLIIYRVDGVDGNLYISQRRDSTWTKIKSLNINTIYWESHGFITPDGKTLYFASNRPGGEGDLDIWISERSENGSWKRPVNCGKVINTPYNENTPFFDPVSNTLYFSSVGHISMGGYDVFQSVTKNGTWTKPLGLPYALNNTAENLFFILNNSAHGFVTSLFDEKTKSRNIYSVLTESPADKTVLAKGTVTLQDEMAIDPDQTMIRLSDKKTGKIKNIPLNNKDLSKFELKPGKFRLIISPIKSRSDTTSLKKKVIAQVLNSSLIDTGSFKFEIEPGDYQLFVSHKGYKPDTINLYIPSEFSSSYIPVNVSLMPDKVFEGDFLAIKNISFDFNSSKLNDQANASLKILKSILSGYPDLKIEVAGYTDSKGTPEYNKKLADNRAQAVINYFTDSGISASRFVKQAVGASDFVALNTNSDGTDNPDGRRYNRRAVFGIINPKTGIVIHKETYAPEHLRQPLSMKYNIILMKSRKNLPPEYFSGLKMTEMHFIKTIITDSLLLYSVGEFDSKNDASEFLDYAKNNGFKDAYIISKYEITNDSKYLMPADSTATSPNNGLKIYTIQLLAVRKQLNMSQFSKISGVKEIASGDGYFRYVCGEYRTYSKAKEELIHIQQSGFKNAFIIEQKILKNH